MDPNAILALIGDLYAQVSRLTAENAALKLKNDGMPPEASSNSAR